MDKFYTWMVTELWADLHQLSLVPIEVALGAMASAFAHERGSGSDTKLSHPALSSHHISCSTSTILSTLGPDHALTVLFLGTQESRTSQWVTHPGNALSHFSLNFRVPTESEANELPKSLMLGRDGNATLASKFPSQLSLLDTVALIFRLM
ncbi:hypothetical protein DVH24_010743 [Malus domestica]|uniref:Uncharacterized protein n=1 Tax=Malus domestica TaxID=3750 RepID=A0A498JRL8_MALDO|nr:hypothetical protein DVH24_010743 [Malus domestica]